MRKGIAVLMVLSFASTLLAQGYMTTAQQEARKKELVGYAQKLLGTKDTHERTTLLKDMLEKDAIRDSQGTALGDGFSVDAFVWLYDQGMTQDDVNARLIAVIGLSSLSAAGARDPLAAAVAKDPAEAIQFRAIQGVEKLSVSRAAKDVQAKLRSPNPDIVAAAARCLVTLNYDPQNQSAGAMIEAMAQAFVKLSQAAPDDPARPDYQRLIEILGQSCSKLIPTITWSPGQTVDDLGKEVGKFTSWLNAKHLPGLKDARIENRREALSQIAQTADRSAFPAILGAVRAEVDRLRAQESFPEKPVALQIVVDGSQMLSRVSGLNNALRSTSTTDDMIVALKQWQDWIDKQPK